MSKGHLTYSEVCDVCDKEQAAGRDIPGAKKIRELLRERGSFTTITTMLRKYKFEHPPPDVRNLPFSSEFVASMQREFGRCLTEKTDHHENEKKHLVEEVNEMISILSECETEKNLLQHEVEEAESRRAAAEEKLKELMVRHSEREKALSEQHDADTKALSEASVTNEKLLLQVHLLTAQIEQQGVQITKLETTITEKDQVAKAAQAALESEKIEKADLKGEVREAAKGKEALQAKLGQLEEQLRQREAELSEERKRNAVLAYQVEQSKHAPRNDGSRPRR